VRRASAAKTAGVSRSGTYRLRPGLLMYMGHRVGTRALCGSIQRSDGAADRGQAVRYGRMPVPRRGARSRRGTVVRCAAADDLRSADRRIGGSAVSAREGEGPPMARASPWAASDSCMPASHAMPCAMRHAPCDDGLHTAWLTD
jgi:hypothetical protein